jgi:UDP-glucuronate 4-epimerase
MAILVTGAAGFIGFHLSRRLIADGETVLGCDNLNSYYDPALKQARLAQLSALGMTFRQCDLSDQRAVTDLFASQSITRVVHLAAQAGVRYSLENPHAYISSNINGFMQVLEACRAHRVEHLIYASSSSVYGLNQKRPFSEHRGADHPVSLYAATKKSNELMAHSYSHLFAIPTTGLRFFTVYGPWGRPDMAYWSFAERILKREPIVLFNHGHMWRDYTYVDDVIESICRVIPTPPSSASAWSGNAPDPAISSARYRIYNIGNGHPIELGRFVEVLEQTLKIKANISYSTMQEGDVEATEADISDLIRDTGYRPQTSIEVGLRHFCDWFTAYRAQLRS